MGFEFCSTFRLWFDVIFCYKSLAPTLYRFEWPKWRRLQNESKIACTHVKYIKITGKRDIYQNANEEKKTHGDLMPVANFKDKTNEHGITSKHSNTVSHKEQETH